MTKAELAEKIASGAGINKTDAAKALESALNAIRSSLKKGHKVTLVGFGTFSTAKRKSRQGRNPKKGQTAKISTVKVPKFIAAKALKDAVQ